MPGWWQAGGAGGWAQGGNWKDAIHSQLASSGTPKTISNMVTSVLYALGSWAQAPLFFFGFFVCLFCFFFLIFLGLYLQRMEVSRLGVKSELQLLAYAMATTTPDPS